MAAQSDLAARVARAHQSSLHKFKTSSVNTGQTLQRGPRQNLRLIESALHPLLPIQRHRNHSDSSRRQRRFEALDALRKHPSQHSDQRPDLMELEQMNEVTQRAVIAAIRNRAVKRRMSFLAQPALCPRRIESRRKVPCLSANRAERSAHRLRFAQTIPANWSSGNFNQRGAANAAIGGKKRKKEAGSNSFCPASDPRDHCCGLGSPYSKPSTAEDGLPAPDRAFA